MKPRPSADTMVAMPQPIMVPETMRMRVSSGRLSRPPDDQRPADHGSEHDQDVLDAEERGLDRSR